MTDIQKFYADVQRIQKHDRADNGGQYDGLRTCKAIDKLFVSQFRNLGDLPQSFADYWDSKYIQNSTNLNQEPTPDHVDWLASALCLLDGTDSVDIQFSKEDWKELCKMVTYEAEDLPLDLLESLMTIFLSKGAM